MTSNYQSLVNCIIIEDEIWIYVYDSATSDQSRESRANGERRQKRTAPKSLKNQAEVNSFLRLWNVAHYEAIRKTRSELWKENSKVKLVLVFGHSSIISHSIDDSK